MKSAILFLYSGLMLFCAYFSLWSIGDYLLGNTLMALLFLPFAFCFGINLHTPKHFWWVSYVAEFSVFVLLIIASPNDDYLPAIILSLIRLPITLVVREYYQGNEAHKLAVQGVLALGMSLLNSLISLAFSFSFFYTFLISLTGMLLIMPACFLGEEYLFKRPWVPLTARLVHKPVSLRTKHILSYIFLFLLNIAIQIYTPEEFHRFALFFLSIPIILLAYYYGWQGAVLGTLLNSIALIASIGSFSRGELSDLLLSISAQTITGIFLGVAIQRQRDLNQSLSMELSRNRDLTRKLINTEEAIRQEISRELHDEIGQNITAIRTQAAIMKRLAPSLKIEQVSGFIEQLSLNVYDTTKGLLNRIRPKILDDLTLKQAIENLFLELDLKTHGISTALFWENQDNVPLEHIQEITLYRLCQEGLNNIVKYAEASNVMISVRIEKQIYLTIQDNGNGFNPETVKAGFGLKGMKERVDVLCGSFQLISKERMASSAKHGTTINITLPRI
ncbi:two-component system sensor histidine kinase UhpB [Rodentibacter caecimuris]|uniref:Two-component system sensor histidine kinase UhpB n=1 Tax=Rodentibacter caecimuris TaxID=1796644 RepID=A0A1V3KMZ7_9PAST|nr:signal transduction histidine-protein kinase/phosphatase UhpB [Rodentibacter heylii]OOF79024.1 two-component system sensor histidine kinase UhpB [Rodentibacter heylii]